MSESPEDFNQHWAFARGMLRLFRNGLVQANLGETLLGRGHSQHDAAVCRLVIDGVAKMIDQSIADVDKLDLNALAKQFEQAQG